jgi:hypothetical protein
MARIPPHEKGRANGRFKSGETAVKGGHGGAETFRGARELSLLRHCQESLNIRPAHQCISQKRKSGFHIWNC